MVPESNVPQIVPLMKSESNSSPDDNDPPKSNCLPTRK